MNTQSTTQDDALMTLIDRELMTRLAERIADPDYQTPAEVARAFVDVDAPHIESKAFRLIDLDEEVISDAVYAACDYLTVKQLAAELMDHGPAIRPVAVSVPAEVFDESMIPF